MKLDKYEWMRNECISKIYTWLKWAIRIATFGLHESTGNDDISIIMLAFSLKQEAKDESHKSSKANELAHANDLL